MATMTCVASNPLQNNTHVRGMIQECFGLEPDEITQILEAHRNNYERQRRYQKTYEERMKQRPEAHAKILQNKRDWYEKNKERVRQYQNERMKNHGEAYQHMLEKRREWYALNSEKIKEKQRLRYHEKHDSDIKKKPGRKPKICSTNDDSARSNSRSSSADTYDCGQ